MLHFPHSLRRRLGLAVLALAGCTTEYVSPIPYERARILGATDTRWVIVGRQTTFNGRPFDVYATSPECIRDNYRILSTDSVLKWHNGTRRCATLDADTANGQWFMSSDYENITLKNDPDLERQSYRISQLNDTLLVLKWAETTASGTALTETITLKLDD